MALPTIQKNWQYDVNNQVEKLGSAALTSANLLLAIKNIMIGFPTNPWTVAGSSDQTTAGMDSVDRWETAASDFRWGASGNISWIVLEQSGMDGYFQLLISTNTTNYYHINMSFSPSGAFAGGSITAPPTASDSVAIKTAGVWGAISGTNLSSIKLHGMQSSDGQCTRIFVYMVSNVSTPELQEPYLKGFWIFDRVQTPSSGWATPYFCSVVGTISAITDIGIISDFNSTLFGVHGSIAMTMSYTWEGTLDGSPFSTVLSSQNKVDGNQYIFPIGIACLTVGARGRHGQIYDLWWANLYLADGTKFTDGLGNDDFIKVGCFILPWPSATELLKA